MDKILPLSCSLFLKYPTYSRRLKNTDKIIKGCFNGDYILYKLFYIDERYGNIQFLIRTHRL